jgi:hypothetical protein
MILDTPPKLDIVWSIDMMSYSMSWVESLIRRVGWKEKNREYWGNLL